MPPQFRELSSLDQFRVCRFLARGEAPSDPKLAAVTLDAAERYQTRGHFLAALFRWWPMVLALVLVVIAVPGALNGRVEMVILLIFIVLGVMANLTLNPWTRPKNVIRSKEASRRIVARMSSQEDRSSAA